MGGIRGGLLWGVRFRSRLLLWWGCRVGSVIVRLYHAHWLFLSPVCVLLSNCQWIGRPERGLWLLLLRLWIGRASLWYRFLVLLCHEGCQDVPDLPTHYHTLSSSKGMYRKLFFLFCPLNIDLQHVNLIPKIWCTVILSLGFLALSWTVSSSWVKSASMSIFIHSLSVPSKLALLPFPRSFFETNNQHPSIIDGEWEHSA